MTLGAQTTGLLSKMHYYIAKLLTPEVNRFNYKDFSSLSYLYFIFGTLAGSIGLLISLFLRLALSPKIYVDNELIHIFYAAHASCTVFFFHYA